MTEEKRLRKQIVDTARAMSARGLAPQRSGNVSARHGSGLLITPSAIAYDAMTAQDIVVVALDGSVAEGQARPSTETPFHLAIYRAREDTAAVVHCHSPAATALACVRRAIPAFHYMVAVAGGHDIRCAEYATFGSEALAINTLRALEDRRACLLANHGQVALGDSLEAALELAAEVETLARQYIDALSVGDPHILDAAEMNEVRDRFAEYNVRP